MANYKGHLSGAFVFFLIYLLGLAALMASGDSRQAFLAGDVVTVLAMFVLCIMFGLWPDVDTNSKGQDIFYTLFFILDVVLIYNHRFHEAAYLGLFCILPILGKHRGWTHTYWAMFVIPSPFLLLPLVYSASDPLGGIPFYGAAVTGYFSHLFMDGLVLKSKPARRKRASRSRR